jgi:beta-glucanase (GH16 family)
MENRTDHVTPAIVSGFKSFSLTTLFLSASFAALIGCGGSSDGGSKSSAAVSSAPVSSAETSSSLASSSANSSSSAPTWELVWSDEFEGTTIDPTKWQHEKNCWGGGNNEQQCYTDRLENSFVADGYLHIVAQREDFTGSDSAEGESPTTKTLPYTSARLRTKNLQEWTFGRFEIRAKLPYGQGTWPAIWMLPTNSPYGNWAASGEIDIMEAVNLKTVTGNNPPESRVHGTLHYGRAWPGNVNAGAEYTLPGNANPADDFHTYAIEWEEGEIRWYVDNVHFATQRDTGWYAQYVQDGVLKDAPVGAPFDRFSKFHLLLNLAVGGNWAGTVNNTGVDESVFPQKMLVDFVRVYQCSASPSTGKGCATVNENAEMVGGHERPVIGEVTLPGPPLFVMYGDELAAQLRYDSYNPDGVISYTQTNEAGRGEIFNVVKTGANGNVYFKLAGDPVDMRNWATTSELIFDVRINSKATDAKLLIKIDSGWPNVSDVEVPLGEIGEWKEFRITLADILDNGNSLAAGRATLASIVNTFVVDPSGPMDISLDNIRLEGSASSGIDQFAQLPLFTLYDDSLAEGLQVQSYNPAGQIVASEINEGGRGTIFKIIKTGPDGNIFFGVAGGPADLSHWSAKGELVFDFKINSRANDTGVLIKMDSGWPNVSDTTLPLPANGVWTEFRIDVADLIAKGNSNACCPGAARLNAITNIFVVEPTGAIDMVIDNIRLIEKP